MALADLRGLYSVVFCASLCWHVQPAQLLPYKHACTKLCMIQPVTITCRQMQHAMTQLCVCPPLLAAACVQVDDAGLYHDLLQHWSQEALQGCSSRALLGALHAASVFTASQSDWVQSGTMPKQPWEHLLAACKQRWGSLSAAERRNAGRSVHTLVAALKGVVTDELSLEVTTEMATVGSS